MMASKVLGKGFHELDFFGKSVELTFKKERTFRTGIGVVVSILCLIFVLTFIFTRTIKIASKSDPFFSMARKSNVNGLVDLQQLGYMFAIEYIDPSVGTITMKYRIQDEINNVEKEK